MAVPIYVHVMSKADGLWITAAGPGEKSGLISLNQIVNRMLPGMVRDAFVEAIKAEKDLLEDNVF